MEHRARQASALVVRVGTDGLELPQREVVVRPVDCERRDRAIGRHGDDVVLRHVRRRPHELQVAGAVRLWLEGRREGEPRRVGARGTLILTPDRADLEAVDGARARAGGSSLEQSTGQPIELEAGSPERVDPLVVGHGDVRHREPGPRKHRPPELDRFLRREAKRGNLAVIERDLGQCPRSNEPCRDLPRVSVKRPPVPFARVRHIRHRPPRQQRAEHLMGESAVHGRVVRLHGRPLSVGDANAL